MSGVPISLPVLVIAGSLCGALVLVGLAGKLARPGRVGRRSLPGLAGLGGSAWWLALAGAAGALWLGGEAIIALFAIVSAAALAGFLASGGTSAAGRLLHVVCCYLCVPLQYGFIAARRYDLFAVCLPLVATLAIPLLTIAQGETRALLERVAERHWGVMVWVYFVSHAPALLMLDIPGFAGGNAGLVAFLVVLALASQWLWSLTSARDGIGADDPPERPTHVRAIRILAVALVGVLGALLAPMTPFSPLAAGIMALLIAVPGFLGCFVLEAIRDGRPVETAGREGGAYVPGVLYPDALAFAAPVFFYAVRAWSAT